MAKSRREFTLEFKREATLRSQPGALPALIPARPIASPSDQAAEIARLRRELDRTRMERDVLKKAIGIFAEMLK